MNPPCNELKPPSTFILKLCCMHTLIYWTIYLETDILSLSLSSLTHT